MSHGVASGIGWALAVAGALAIAGTVGLVNFESAPPPDRPRAAGDRTFRLEFIEEGITVLVEMDSSAGGDVRAGLEPDGET